MKTRFTYLVPTRQNRFGATVGSFYYWKYCSIAEPPRQKGLWICPWQHLNNWGGKRFEVNSLNCLSNTKIWVRFIFIDGRHLFFFLLFWKIFILWKKWPNLFFTFSFYQIFKNNIPKASWLRLFRMNWTNNFDQSL
jgi:hypothetical protein